MDRQYEILQQMSYLWSHGWRNDLYGWSHVNTNKAMKMSEALTLQESWEADEDGFYQSSTL